MTDTHGKTIRTIVGLPKQEEIHIDLRAYVEPEQRFLNGKDVDTGTVYIVVFDGFINDVPVLYGRVDDVFDTNEDAERIGDAVLEQLMGSAQNDMDMILSLLAAYRAHSGKDLVQ